MVMMMPVPKGGMKAYYSSMKDHRRKIADFYRENETVSIPQVMKEFGVSRNTVRRALRENGVDIEEGRGKNMEKIRYFHCSDCGRKLRHVCSEENPQEIQPQKPKSSQSSSKPQELAQELDHIPLKDEDWAWTDDRILDLLYKDGVSPQELNQLLQGNQTPYPTVDSAIRAYKEKRPFAVYRQRYMVQFLKGDRDYPKGIPLHQLID